MHPLQRLIRHSPDVYKILREQIEHWQAHGEIANSQLITFVNPYSYMLLRKDIRLCQTLDAVYCDAISSARFSSLCLGKTIHRISFDYGSLAKTFLAQMNQYPIPVFFLGSDEFSIKQAVSNICLQYPNVNVCGMHHGYFSQAETPDILDKIAKSQAQFVIIGMGTPRQEHTARMIIEQYSLSARKVHCFTCGGFLTQTSEQLSYYPIWINRYHLRWLWRLVKEKQVLMRLVREYPKFVLAFLFDRTRKSS